MPRAKRGGSVWGKIKKVAKVAVPLAVLGGLAARTHHRYKHAMEHGDQIVRSNPRVNAMQQAAEMLSAKGLSGGGRRRRRAVPRGRGRVTNLAKKAAAAALAAATAGYVANRIPRTMAKRKKWHEKTRGLNRVIRLPHSGEHMSARGRRGKLKRIAKATLIAAASSTIPHLADHYFQPIKRPWGWRNPQQSDVSSGGSLTSWLLPIGAAAAAYKYHAPSRRAMQAGYQVLRNVGPAMARAWSGSGYKAGVSRMKRLQPNPRKPRKGTPRRPRVMATIRGRGAWDDIMTGFSMPFHALGDVANAAAPALPFLKFLG